MNRDIVLAPNTDTRVQFIVVENNNDEENSVSVLLADGSGIDSYVMYKYMLPPRYALHLQVPAMVKVGTSLIVESSLPVLVAYGR